MEGSTVECSLDGSSRQAAHLYILPFSAAATSNACNILAGSSNDAFSNRISISESCVRRLIARPSSSSSNIILCPVGGSTQLDNFSALSKDSNINASVIQVKETTNFSQNEFSKNVKRKDKSKSNNVRRRLHRNLNLPFELPKPPLTAYSLFCKNRRPILKLEHSDTPLSEMMKILGKEWSTLSKPNKQTFIDMANQELARYKRELSNLKSSSKYKTYMRRLKNDRKNAEIDEIVQHNSLKNADEDLLNEFFEKPTSLTVDVGKTEGDRNECSDSLFSFLDEELYCPDCKIYFTNFHNKSQHEISKRHLFNLKKKVLGSTPTSKIYARNRPMLDNHEDWANDFVLNCYLKNQECEFELKSLEDRFKLLTSRNQQLNLLTDHFEYEKQRRTMQLKLMIESNSKLQSNLLCITSIIRLLSDENEEEDLNIPNDVIHVCM